MRVRRALGILVMVALGPVRATAQETGSGSQTGAGSGSETGSRSESEADPRADAHARELYLQGDQAYAEGRYEAAIALFRDAYRLSARPLLLFNLANAYERIGRLEEALEALEGYLPSAAGDERDEIDARIVSLRARVDASREARVEPRDEAPIEPIVVAPVLPPTPPPVEAASYVPVGPITVLVLAGVSTLAGIVTGAVALDADARASGSCTSVEGGRVCTDAASGPLSTAQTLAGATDVLLASGLVLASAGVVWAIFDAPAAEAPHISARVGPLSLELRCAF
jgi:Tetratricopeptide repeat